jgi:hypothetical protein
MTLAIVAAGHQPSVRPWWVRLRPRYRFGGIRQNSALRVITLGLLTVVWGCGQRTSDLGLLLNGPVQNFDGTALGSYVDNRETVLAAISKDAGFGGRSPINPPEWNQFVIAAFGYADAQCEDYLSALRRLDIVRRQTTQEINLVGAATVGILGIAEAAASAIAITGVAFGLAQATVDNFTRGLLYDLPPSTVYGLVRRMKLAYAAGLTDAAWQNRASSFRTIRGYIELCLPLVIEANANNAVAVAQAVTEVGNSRLATPPGVSAGGGGGAGSGASTSTPGAADIAATVAKVLKEQTITNPRAPLPKPITVPKPPDCLTDAECHLPAARIKQYQTALCVGPTGAFDSLTRTAIHDYFLGGRFIKSTDTTNGIDNRTKAFLDQASDLNCATAGFKNAYEVGYLGEKYPQRIEDLQSNLQGLLKKTPPLAKNGKLDQNTRDAIAEICGKREIDFECRTKIDDSVIKLKSDPAKPSGPG